MPPPEKSTCKSCGEEIFFVTMGTGAKMPINKKRYTLVFKVKEDYWSTISGYESHFATCPKAEDHRKKDAKKPPTVQKDTP